MNHNEEVPDLLGGIGDLLPADVLKMVNELLEQLHRKEKDHQGSIVFNIYEKGSLHVDHVDNQYFYGDKWIKALQNKVVADDQPSAADPVFDKDDDASVDALAITHFEFDKNRIYSNKVYYDLLDLEVVGALQVSLSQLSNYLANHTNLSSSYATLYRQLKKYRQERP